MTETKKRNEKIGEIIIKAKMPNTGEEIDFCIFCPREILEKNEKEKIENEIKEQIKNVNVDKPLIITGVTVPYEPVDELKIENYGFNTLIQISLPYCLHLPNHYPLGVDLGNGEKACIELKKVWTEKATGSNESDFLAKDRVCYFSKPDIITPQFPQEENVGWDLRFTGKNIEKVRDTNGYFRYSRLNIFFDTNFKKEEIDDRGYFSEGILKVIAEKTQLIVNKFLDIYKVVTEEDFVDRIGFLNITHILFFEHNSGLLLTSPNYGYIQSAVMNRSRNELEKIEKMLKEDIHPELYELLFLNASNSLKKKMFTLAIVESFQALEIFLENYLMDKFSNKGLSESDIKGKLEQKWRTKERLKDLLKEATGKSLSADNQTLWNKWVLIYDNIRNEVIHKGKEVNESDAMDTLEKNKEVVSWIKSII